MYESALLMIIFKSGGWLTNLTVVQWSSGIVRLVTSATGSCSDQAAKLSEAVARKADVAGLRMTEQPEENLTILRLRREE